LGCSLFVKRQQPVIHTIFFAGKARTKNLNGGFHVASPISVNPSETFIGVRHASSSIILQSLRFANRMPFIKNFLVRYTTDISIRRTIFQNISDLLFWRNHFEAVTTPKTCQQQRIMRDNACLLVMMGKHIYLWP
jgi:hypothetical protein